jgi:hypothetical protein
LTSIVNNSSENSDAISALTALNGINSTIASNIIERIQSGKRITNYLAQIGITKKSLELQNPTKLIVQ